MAITLKSQPPAGNAIRDVTELYTNNQRGVFNFQSSYRLKDLCERANFEFCRCPTIFEGGTENLSNYLAYLIVPLLVQCSTGRGGKQLL